MVSVAYYTWEFKISLNIFLGERHKILIMVVCMSLSVLIDRTSYYCMGIRISACTYLVIPVKESMFMLTGVYRV